MDQSECQSLYINQVSSIFIGKLVYIKDEVYSQTHAALK